MSNKSKLKNFIDKLIKRTAEGKIKWERSTSRQYITVTPKKDRVLILTRYKENRIVRQGIIPMAFETKEVEIIKFNSRHYKDGEPSGEPIISINTDKIRIENELNNSLKKLWDIVIDRTHAPTDELNNLNEQYKD
ncbi:MAG: hypothetical protein ACOC56_04790 [Atribacterota bacterium]